MAGLSLELGLNLEPVELENVERVLDLFLDSLIEQMQLHLDRADKNASGNLRESMEKHLFYEDSAIHSKVEFPNAPYWVYVEYGVKGAQTQDKAPQSPFQFGSRSRSYAPGTMRNAIRGWLGHRRFQWRDARGRFMSYDDMTPLITRSVYLHGIEPTPFVSDHLERVWRRFWPQLAEALTDDLEEYIEEENLFDSFTINFSI